MPITVVVPTTTPEFIVTKMRSEGAKVEVVGSVSNPTHRIRDVGMHVHITSYTHIV